MSLQWFKDESPLESSVDFVINTIQSKLSILLLTSVGAEHSGVYACKATNPVGESYQEAPLYVNGDCGSMCTNIAFIYSKEMIHKCSHEIKRRLCFRERQIKTVLISFSG